MNYYNICDCCLCTALAFIAGIAIGGLLMLLGLY